MTYLVPIKETLSATHGSSVYTAQYFNNFISSDAVDEANVEWDDVTTFGKDGYVKVSDLNRVYRCAAQTSTGEYPPANPSIWVDYGATNKFRLFDERIGSQTKFDTNMELSIGANKINSLGFLNMDNVSSITIAQTDLNTSHELYNETFNLIDFGVLSLYDYWYRPVSYKRDLVVQDLYFSTNSKLEISFSGSTTAGIGALVSGLADKIGLTLYGSKVRLKDYSKYEVDEYGNTSFTKRGYARIITGSVLIDTNLVDETLTKLAALRGDMTLYIADETKDGFSSMSTLGYIEEIEIEPTTSKTKYPIKIIGVI